MSKTCCDNGNCALFDLKKISHCTSKDPVESCKTRELVESWLPPKMKHEYKILSLGKSIEVFEKEIAAHLNDGWQLAGDLLETAAYTADSYTKYPPSLMQPLIRSVEVPPNEGTHQG